MTCESKVRESYIDKLKVKENLLTLAENFQAGQIRYFFENWKDITIDEDILDMVLGVDISFEDLPKPTKLPENHCFSNEQKIAIQEEINSLLKKGVIKKAEHSNQERVSPIFVVPKKDGKWRMILNLKDLNLDIEYKHFKMETFKDALALITKGCFMCSLDLKDAYFSVHVNESSQEYLKFYWENQLYTFTAFPNGLACCPRLFTKLLKPVMAQLHLLGFISTIFIDDTLLIGESREECERNLSSSLALFQRLGFVVHPEKSVICPSNTITYLGFVIDSVLMRVTPTQERKDSIYEMACELLERGQSTIRQLASFIGKVVSCFHGVKYGPLHYRNMEWDKTQGLSENKGNFDAQIYYSSHSVEEMKWWKDNILEASLDIQSDAGEPNFVIYSDASLSGWGCYCEIGRTGGHWDAIESKNHINVLELKAAYLALQCFAKDKNGIHIRLMMDNTTAVACVMKMGTSHSMLCNEMTQLIWGFCIERNIWLSAAFIPGKLNVEADEESRKLNMDAEWCIKEDILVDALSILNFKPDIDLFASRINKQYDKYVAFRPDPNALYIDAFTISWSSLNFYAFPPFCVISRVLHKVYREQAKGVIVVPDWPTQTWYPLLGRLMIQKPVLVSARDNLLHLPAKPKEKHRLRKSLRLLICLISGKDTESQDFQMTLPTLFVQPVGQEHRNNMLHTLRNGKGMQLKDKFIPFRRL